MELLSIEKNTFLSLKELFSFSEIFSIIAGPCAIESYEQMEQVAKIIKSLGLNFIRGGAYKPRTSPHAFQGLGAEGIKILNDIKRKYELISVTEVMDTRDVEFVSEYTDIIQIGSRNMSNFSLLKEVGKVKNPVLLKRGLMATVEEFLLAAEYIVSSGNKNIIMCERGIRTFETGTRNTLDLSCVAIIKKRLSLPVIVDLSHSLGRKDIIIPMAHASRAVGADGVMIETHPNPKEALSDSNQQLNLNEFNMLVKNMKESACYYHK